MQIESCNKIFNARMIIEVAYYFAICIFYGYFGIQFLLKDTLFAFIIIQALPILVSGYSIYSIARLSTNLSGNTFQFFNELTEVASKLSDYHGFSSKTQLKVLYIGMFF
jgi:hypothetical protein